MAVIPVTDVGDVKLAEVEYSTVYVSATETASQLTVTWVELLVVATTPVGTGTTVVLVWTFDHALEPSDAVLALTRYEWVLPVAKPENILEFVPEVPVWVDEVRFTEKPVSSAC